MTTGVDVGAEEDIGGVQTSVGSGSATEHKKTIQISLEYYNNYNNSR